MTDTRDVTLDPYTVWWVPCYRCNGSGEIVTCIDDMCRGADECMHGDGMSVCPECGGDGELECEEPTDD